MVKNQLWRWLGGLTIVAVFVFGLQTETSAQSFTDVPADHPYQEVINEMQEKGYINGYPDGSFKPNAAISRQHVAHLLAKVMPLETKVYKTIRYKDVPTDHPYYDDIVKVSQAGIFSGDVNGNFNPSAPLTRLQMAKVLDLAFDLNITSVKHFHDMSQSWGYLHVQALASNEITTGDNGYYKPSQPVTRAHYAVFLHRALNMPPSSKPEPGAQLSKAEILNLLYRIPFQTENTLVYHKKQASPYNRVLDDLMEYATYPLADGYLRNYYDEMCINCDMFLFYPLDQEIHHRFEIVENKPNRIKLRTVSFQGILQEAFFIEYAFERQSGKWKLSAYNLHNVGAGSFELTKEEAVQIAQKELEKYEVPPVRVSYVNTEHKYVYDWYTNKSYPRAVYRLHVRTGERSFGVDFYPHNGLLDWW